MQYKQVLDNLNIENVQTSTVKRIGRHFGKNRFSHQKMYSGRSKPTTRRDDRRTKFDALRNRRKMLTNLADKFQG